MAREGDDNQGHSLRTVDAHIVGLEQEMGDVRVVKKLFFC